jgi:choline-sulfatase
VRSAFVALTLAAIGPCGGRPVAPTPDASAEAPVAAEIRDASVEPTKAAPSIENVVLITIDAMRADQPWTGYTRVSTPNLSALAAKSIVYENAYALSNMTTTSLSAMLAGRYPSELARSRCPLAGYAPRADALAPTLRESGVRTVAVLGHLAFVARLVPDIGFDAWRLIENAAAPVTHGAVSGEAIAKLFARTIAEAGERGRFFAWAHFIDPHDKYVAHRDFPASDPGPRGLYDGEVAYTDAMIGRVLSSLETAPYASRTAILVTADHGEAFGEHGARKHGFSTYDEELRIPLLLYVPGIAPRRITAVRGAIDIAPTVAALLGVPAPSAWRGTSLLEDLNDVPAARPVIVDMPELDGRPPSRVVLIDGHKVVTGAAGTRVHDLESDPGETHPFKEGAAPFVDRARAAAHAVMTEVPPHPCVKL